jgi:hypothetical protein
MEDLDEPLLLRNIRQDEWVNPFGASAPEILAAALEESGLLLKNTVINDQPAQQFYQSYCQKRSRFKESTRLGALLIQEGYITREQMMLGLTMQMTTTQSLSDILVEMALVSPEQITGALERQRKYQTKQQIKWKNARRLFRHTPHDIEE